MSAKRPIWDLERDTVRRTERDNEEVCTLWSDGIRLLGENLTAITEWSEEVARDHAMLGALSHAANTQLCGYRLATSGYCVQAQGLIRICEEDNVAFIYLWEYPDQAERFLRVDLETPRWGEMLDGVRRKLGDETADALQGGMKWLHKLTHIDSRSVRGSYDVRPISAGATTTTAHFRMGPHYDQEDFILCAGQFMNVLHSLIYDSIGMCQLTSTTPPHPKAATDFGERFKEWTRRVAERP